MDRRPPPPHHPRLSPLDEKRRRRPPLAPRAASHQQLDRPFPEKRPTHPPLDRRAIAHAEGGILRTRGRGGDEPELVGRGRPAATDPAERVYACVAERVASASFSHLGKCDTETRRHSEGSWVRFAPARDC